MRMGGSVREVVVGGRDWVCVGWVYPSFFLLNGILVFFYKKIIATDE